MMIEIRKAGFINKGAELMLYAILEQLKGRYPDVKFCMAPMLMAPYEKRVELGFYQKVFLWKKGIHFSKLAKFIPKKLRKQYGLILDSEVDVVIDASGFSYSDQWGTQSCEELADSCEMWHANGTKVIVLPQAFGPFNNAKNVDSMKKAIKNIDLLYARESISYDYMVGAVGKQNNIKINPDFTNLIQGIVPEDFNQEENKFCIVPNYRMIDKTSKEQSEAYLPFMIECTKYLKEQNQKPFILIHEDADDLTIAEEISKAAGGVNIIREANPLKIKGIIGASEGTIGSRFHGLVSALSQGVPSLATGWSHKYKMLFKDYNFEDGLMDVTMSKQEIKNKINLIIQPKSKEEIKETITMQSEELKKLSQSMWNDIFNIIDKK